MACYVRDVLSGVGGCFSLGWWLLVGWWGLCVCVCGGFGWGGWVWCWGSGGWWVGGVVSKVFTKIR